MVYGLENTIYCEIKLFILVCWVLKDFADQTQEKFATAQDARRRRSLSNDLPSDPWTGRRRMWQRAAARLDFTVVSLGTIVSRRQCTGALT